MNDARQYDRPIAIADGIYWVGFYEEDSNFHCNPYLIIEGDEAVLIDGGSRPDFAVVMMKILQTGIRPEQIVALIYQHPDPDLCGSMPNMIDLCANRELSIVSDPMNHIFINYYIGKHRHHLLKSISAAEYTLTVNGRTLQFYKTPFVHSSGSFVTYDPKTKTLFSSDLFGSFSREWELFVQFAGECPACTDYEHCVNNRKYCPLSDIESFHRTIMPCGKALAFAMGIIKALDVQILAPQHGSVFTQKRDIDFLIKKLESLDGVGIDGVL
ncbi:MAG: MBL fold metallo-hydrolase [Deltaproteobacteria bacterium]|nr:MBL fold metallo-hydrolase [Deltaproteobacteria bacterium]